MERIEIYTSKKKSLLLLLGALVFVVLGAYLFMEADHINLFGRKHPMMIRGLGIASILFFGLGIFVGIKRIIRSEIGLVIDSTGLKVRPNKPTSEYIKWEDILGFEEIKIEQTRMLIIGVKNPEYYVENETSSFRRRLMKMNINNYGSPFNIGASGLDISADELNETLSRYFERYNNEAPPSA